MKKGKRNRDMKKEGRLKESQGDVKDYEKGVWEKGGVKKESREMIDKRKRGKGRTKEEEGGGRSRDERGGRRRLGGESAHQCRQGGP